MKFSIIIPTYNRSILIRQAIQSVLDQSYSNFEIIIVDDGSTDDTESVTKNYKDSRIFYYKHKKVGKLSILRNYGMRKATGELITFLDSDDKFNPNKLQISYDAFNTSSHISIFLHNIAFIDKDGVFISKAYSFKKNFCKNILKDILKNKILPFTSYVFKKNLLETTGLMNEEFNDGHQDFLIRLAVSNPAYYDTRCLMDCRKHEGNMSTDFSENMFDKFQLGALKEYLYTLNFLWDKRQISKKLLNKRKSLTFYSIACLLKLQNRISESNAYFRTCISMLPVSLHTFKSIVKYTYFKNSK